MKARHKLCLLLFTVWLPLARTETGASLSGVIKDPQGRPVPGATVRLFSRTGSGGSSSTTSDSSGVYRFQGLPAGDYILRADAPGFATFLAEDVPLTPAAPRLLDAVLQVAGVREEVVVTASSTPQAPEEVSKAMTVIDRAEAEERDSAALSDVLQMTPGVRVQRLGGPGAFTGIRLRGLRNQDTSILIDGLRFRDPSATQADASGLIQDLLFTDASRVEVLRGSGSSLYGTNAIGGVVNVITDEGGGRTRGTLLGEGGSLGASRGRLQMAGSLRGDRIQYSAGLTHANVIHGVDGDDPFRDTNAQGRVTFHLSPSMRLAARLYAGDSFTKLNSGPVSLGSLPARGIINAVPLAPAEVRRYELGTPVAQLAAGNATFIPAADDPDSTRAARFLSGALILTGQPSPALHFSIAGQILAAGRRYGNGPAGTGFQPRGGTRSLYDGRIQSVTAHVDYRLGALNLLSAGYEFENENFANDNADQSNPVARSAVSVTQRSHALLVQDQARLLGGRLHLSGALRAQFFTLDRPAFQPAASAPYRNVPFATPPAAYTGDGSAAYLFRKIGAKLRAHAGRGYRAPSLFERFGAGFDPTFGYSIYGDPRLRPEHSISLDAGVDQMFLQGRMRASATYFYTRLEQVIIFDFSGFLNPAADPFGRFAGYRNTQGGLSRGVELSAACSPARSFNVSTAYTYVNASESTPVAGVLRSFIIPRNQFSIVASERLGSRLLLTLDTIASGNYLAPVFGGATRVYRFDGIHKINLGASYRIPLGEFTAVRFFVRVENLLHQNYFESGFPTPGRTGRGGMQLEF
jgi:vitamin B12 transporter